MKTEDIDKIKELFFKRVEDAEMRVKILKIASGMVEAEVDDEDEETTTDDVFGASNPEANKYDDFWKAIYHYSLKENWPDIDDDLNTFVVG